MEESAIGIQNVWLCFGAWKYAHTTHFIVCVQ